MSQLRAEAALVIVEPERLRAPASAYAQCWEAKILYGSCVVVGIDVAKLGAERLAHDAEGHTALQLAGRRWWSWRPLVAARRRWPALPAAGIAVADVSPLKAREFAKSMGCPVKTECIGARTFIELGLSRRCAARTCTRFPRPLQEPGAGTCRPSDPSALAPGRARRRDAW